VNEGHFTYNSEQNYDYTTWKKEDWTALFKSLGFDFASKHKQYKNDPILQLLNCS